VVPLQKWPKSYGLTLFCGGTAKANLHQAVVSRESVKFVSDFSAENAKNVKMLPKYFFDTQ